MQERSIEDRVTRVEMELELFLKAGETFRTETKEELKEIRQVTRNINRMIIGFLASATLILLAWGLNLLVKVLNGQ